jgi:uncharacterized protein YqeY
MTQLIEKIKSDQLTARKERNGVASALLTTLIGDAVAIGKNDGGRPVTDSEVVALIKKYISNMHATITHLGDSNPEAVKIVNEEIEILSQYLPQQLSEEEMNTAITGIIFDVGQNMGKIMGALKSRYDGQYDGKMASSIVKGLLGS